MSWNLTKGADFLPNISLRELRDFYACEKHAKAKIRLLVAVKRKEGKSLDDIAESVSTARMNVHRWLANFQQGGIAAKESIKQTGRPPRLTNKQRKSLIADLERGPPHNPSGLWQTKEVRELLRKKYKTFFVYQHVWRIIESLGFSLQRPRKRHYKSASEEEKELFKKKLDKKQGIIEKKVLLWAHRMKQHSALSRS